MKPSNNQNPGKSPEQNKKAQTIGEQVNYTSPDGQVEIVTKRQTARRFPQHSYPIVCLRLRPMQGTRVQQLSPGEAEGLDVLLTEQEHAETLKALNAADPKAKYTWREIVPKPADRKGRWDRINAARHAGNGGE